MPKLCKKTALIHIAEHDPQVHIEQLKALGEMLRSRLQQAGLGDQEPIPLPVLFNEFVLNGLDLHGQLNTGFNAKGIEFNLKAAPNLGTLAMPGFLDLTVDLSLGLNYAKETMVILHRQVEALDELHTDNPICLLSMQGWSGELEIGAGVKAGVSAGTGRIAGFELATDLPGGDIEIAAPDLKAEANAQGKVYVKGHFANYEDETPRWYSKGSHDLQKRFGQLFGKGESRIKDAARNWLAANGFAKSNWFRNLGGVSTREVLDQLAAAATKVDKKLAAVSKPQHQPEKGGERLTYSTDQDVIKLRSQKRIIDMYRTQLDAQSTGSEEISQGREGTLMIWGHGEDASASLQGNVTAGPALASVKAAAKGSYKYTSYRYEVPAPDLAEVAQEATDRYRIAQHTAISYAQVKVDGRALVKPGIRGKKQANKSFVNYNMMNYKSYYVFGKVDPDTPSVLTPKNGGMSFGTSTPVSALMDCLRLAHPLYTDWLNQPEQQPPPGRSRHLPQNRIEQGADSIYNQLKHQHGDAGTQVASFIDCCASRLKVTYSQLLLAFLDSGIFDLLDLEDSNAGGSPELKPTVDASGLRPYHTILLEAAHVGPKDRQVSLSKTSSLLGQYSSDLDQANWLRKNQQDDSALRYELQSIRFRYRIADSQEHTKGFRLGITFDNSDFGFRVKKFDKAAIEGVVDLSTYWFGELAGKPPHVAYELGIPQVALLHQ